MDDPRARPRQTPAGAIVDGWRSSLRTQHQHQHQQRSVSPLPPQPVSPRSAHFNHQHHSTHYDHNQYTGRLTPTQARSPRPPSGLSNQSNPSLLSLEHNQPLSPATTVDPYQRYPNPSTSSLSLPHHYNHPAPHQYRHSQPHLHPSASSSAGAAHPARSHASLPAPPVSYVSGGSVGRHQHQMNRVYPPQQQQKYDADFDRSLPSTTASSAGPSRELFNPNSSSLHLPSSASPAPPSHHQHSSSSATAVPPPRDRSTHRQRERSGGDRDRPQRSKREPVDPNDLGRRAQLAHPSGRGRGAAAGDSKESLESVETDFSGRTKSSAGPSSRRRKARRGEDDEGEGGAGEGEAGGAGKGKNRQLFDPRKDDPMRFVHGSSTSLPAGGKKLASDAKSVASFASNASTDAGGGHDAPYPNGAGGGADDAASILTGASAASGRKEQHPALAQIKRAYREITDLEGRLQDEHKAAMRERVREVEEKETGGAGGKRIKVEVVGRKWDDEYWVRLANGHKQLADAHYSFLQLALDPRLPAAMNQLPTRYNIPTRLWQTAFHQLLERMRHTVLSSPLPSSSTGSGSGGEAEGANVLEHLIEFIQYAYGHYSQLLEDPTVATFRAAWIEQLGDLARYRMAVAGLASRVHAAQQQQASSSSSSAALTSSNLEASSSSDSKPRPRPVGSIGQAALNDWDLEEQETWREMARDWYAQGVAENPGTGRLQHHLALLSKGDEVRSLYHYVKSLSAAHPYLSARESILPLFEDEHQARRTQPDVSKAELFVHLHGMLFTKISLDDFSDVHERFLERLREEGWALGKALGGRGAVGEFGTGAQAPFGDREWFMLGVINVAALLQYGAEDGVLKKLMSREEEKEKDGHGGKAGGGGKHGGGKHGHRSHHHGQHHHGAASSSSTAVNRSAPQAIMLKRAEDGATTSTGGAGTGDETERPGGTDDVLKPLNAAPTSTSPADDPLPFKLAQRLAFSLLTFLVRHTDPFRQIGSAKVLNPYLTLLLTFLAYLSSHPAAFAHVEQQLPWDDLVALLNLLPSSVEVRIAEAPNKLVGGRPLPEDWCIRGMDWAGRQLFGRGYWREHRPSGREGARIDDDPSAAFASTAMRVESEMDALKFDLSSLSLSGGESGGEEQQHQDTSASTSPAAALAEGRWRRLALCGAWLVRNVPGLDYDYSAPLGERFRIAQPLKGKVGRWREEEEAEKRAEREAARGVRERTARVEEVGEETEESEESEDEENEEDSEAVRELKARRRALKAVIRQARQVSRSAPSGTRAGHHVKLGGRAATIPKVFAGYTVLVFDTNILLTSIKLFRELIEAECWTIVVPLAVITELDGLKRNTTALGSAAIEVVDYLESAVRTHSRYLKIQTSRGNYLKDLAIRNESIDFSGSTSSSSSAFDLVSSSFDLSSSSSHDQAHSLDDVILRAVSWQSQHFTSRLALVNPRAVRPGAPKVPTETATVVLVTFDRNLRLKARARGLEATEEKGLKRALEVAHGQAAAAGAG
ncbi:hypothetical protein JCM8547_001150 [Rhodosporidiobolus lusitaniae]